MSLPSLRTHQGLLAGIVLVAALGKPCPVVAQRIPDSPFELGLTIGATPNYPKAFDRCGTGFAGSFGGRLAARLTTFWHAELRTDIVSGVATSPCFVCEACFCSFDRCVIPPPATGSYVVRDGRFDPPLFGSSFWITRLDSDWTVARHASKEWRVGVGVGRMWGKHLWTPQLASSLHWGSGSFRGIVEVSVWRYTVQRTDIENSYLNGQLVSQAFTREPIHETTVFLNIGLALHRFGKR